MGRKLVICAALLSALAAPGSRGTAAQEAALQETAAQETAAQETAPRETSDQPRSSPAIERDHHPWARFPPGAWRKSRVLEHTLDAQQQVASETTSIRVERLTEVGPQQFSLQQQVEIESGGQRVEPAAKTVSFIISTDEPGTIQTAQENAPESVPLDGRDIEARVLQFETSGGAYSVGALLWYAPKERPYVLRSIVEARAPLSNETVWRRSRRVVATGLPFLLQENEVEATFLEEHHATTKGARRSILVWVDHVPGGLAARWTKETNTDGRLIRREIETLLDWGHAPEPEARSASVDSEAGDPRAREP